MKDGAFCVFKTEIFLSLRGIPQDGAAIRFFAQYKSDRVFIYTRPPPL